MEAETAVEQAQARHRKELKDLQGRITNKKKNATKKTRKAVNDDCEQLERALREQQAAEIAALNGEMPADDDAADEVEQTQLGADESLSRQVEAELNLATEKETDRVDDNTQQQQQQQQQQPGKKRNRQKERLARRAAEQAAATTKAEMEASTMTNHRAIENAYMKKKMEAEGLVEQDIAPDGHCLFSAVADQLQTQLSIPLGGTATTTVSETKEPAYKTVRRAATDFMASHGDDFAPFVEGDFATYLARMRDTAEWGGEPELMALARAYGVGIRVVQDGRTEEFGDGDRVMWLAYYRHGYGLGEHYNSLRRQL
ncbi:OTU domain-containing protein 2 [Beauveria bassiana]|uniref:OTU domain-containing protein 2 n=1 Tax=Beauveria bassiana TaxID=176275 RepID=A0A2N6NK18_BEABA|nr:OTU domain-containing protein 2 [Beauveria bassiana]